MTATKKADCLYYRGPAGHTRKTLERPGAEYILRDGYTVIKIAGVFRWQLKHRLIWEKAFGELPPGYALFFMDGDKANFSLDNLRAINRKMLVFMNLKKISLSVLKDPAAGAAIAALHQLCRQRKMMARARKGEKHRFQNLPPLYLPVNRPGFAY